MHYVSARIIQKNEEELYKFYVADTLQGMFTNQYYQTSFKDILQRPKIEQKSADEIVNDIIERAGLVV